jgi:hypothetical protein
MTPMADDKPNVLVRAARAATSPVRDYLNNHFEMVKQEVRSAGATNAGTAAAATGSGDGNDAWARVAELENLLAEQSVHQARVLARLTEEVVELTARIEDVERLLRQLAVAVSAPVADD